MCRYVRLNALNVPHVPRPRFIVPQQKVKKMTNPRIELHELFVDSFRHDHDRQLRAVVFSKGPEGRHQLGYFVVSGVLEPALADPVPEDDDAVG